MGEFGEFGGGWVAEKKNNPKGEVKEIMVFESFFPQGQNWFYLHLQLEVAIRKGVGVVMAGTIGS